MKQCALCFTAVDLSYLSAVGGCFLTDTPSSAPVSKGGHSDFGSHFFSGAAMPAIASLEDLKSAQKDLQEAKDLNELKAAFKKWRRIGWKNVCGAPMGKGRAIQRLGGGDIPRLTSGQAVQEVVVFSAGVSCGCRKGRRSS